MNDEKETPGSTYHYTVWSDDGEAKSYGPFEAKVTYYGLPDEDDDELQDHKSA